MSVTVDFDVGIIGGGPAGSAMASYLAKAGVSCVLFERELFPRPHVGESLVPSSNRVLGELGFLPKMEEARFPRKYGAVWTSSTSSSYAHHEWEGNTPQDFADIRFSERKQEGVFQDYTYHVDRGLFDVMFLQHAQGLGATVYEGVKVAGADFSDPDFARVRFSIGKKESDVRVRVVIDASGRSTLLGTQLGWKLRDKVFDQLAVHTWFDGFDRGLIDKKKQDYIYVHFLPVHNSWIWQIPITDTVTSIGVVTQKKNWAKTGQSHEDFFWNWVGSRPQLKEALKASHQVRPFKTEGDYSYAMKQIIGDRVILIGDAARFVDPIFSSGVSIALNGARLASRDVLKALEVGDFSRGSFSTYEQTLRCGTRNWYEFIALYYRLNVLFTMFIQDPRYRLDVLKLLQGDVYEEQEPAVLKEMRRVVTAVEQDDKHLWHKLLGDMTAYEFRPTF